MNFADTLDEDLYSSLLSRGDPAAMEALVARWQAVSQRIARRICRNGALAEEAVQEAFLKLLSGKARFRRQGSGTFRSWFLTLVANTARMALRQELRAEARKRIEPQDYVTRKGLDRTAPPGDLEHPSGAALALTLEAIEERWRTPIILHFMGGVRLTEIAKSAGVSQQMISKRLSEGLRHLRARFVSPLLPERKVV